MMLQRILLPLILFLCVMVLPSLSLPQKYVRKNAYKRPKSCLEYLKLGYNADGYYLVYKKNTAFTVYCDMNSEAGSAWTLVMSYALENIKMKQFQTSGLQVNAPVNAFSPNWNTYRMAYPEIKHLASVSTHWRATCDFPKYGVDYTDYVRAKFSVFDIVKFLGWGVCKKAEYVDIRGSRCAHCTGIWWQSNTRSPHMASGYRSCQFRGKRPNGPNGEDNFNFYGSYNKKFRCSSGPKATTNWWFGGYLS